MSDSSPDNTIASILNDGVQRDAAVAPPTADSEITTVFSLAVAPVPSAQRPPRPDVATKKLSGEDVVAVAELTEGVARFKSEEAIGRGGTGEVIGAFDRKLQRKVALKVLNQEIAPLSVDGLRFLEEAQVTGQLDHPTIVPIYDLIEDTNTKRPVIVMKLVRGKTLKDVVTLLGAERLHLENLEQLVRQLIQVCNAIAFANNKGVVHCDLKPDNIMLGRYGQVYLLDWGNAKLLASERLSEDENALPRSSGTPSYMAPEQVGAFDSRLDVRTDVFGLGGILYFLLTLHPPRPAPKTNYDAMMAAYEAKVEPPQSMAEVRLPPELCRITMRCLQREPDARYEDVIALRDDLEKFLRGGGWLATRCFVSGTAIVREGDVGEYAYVIVEGCCQVRRLVDGKQVVLADLEAGDVFGETAILTSKPRTASVVATTDVIVKVLDREAMDRELERTGWMSKIVLTLAERFRNLAVSGS